MRQGFTLAELLIALAILGVIATFTIPKVLSAQQDNRSRAIGKEVAAMLSGSFEAYKLQNTLSASTRSTHFTPFMNYVKVDSTSLIDSRYGSASSRDCSTSMCLLLHNGAILNSPNGLSFNGAGTTNAVYFYLDPDGKYDSTTTGPAKSVVLFLYYSGRIKSFGTVDAGTTDSSGTYTPQPTYDPPWFGWD